MTDSNTPISENPDVQRLIAQNVVLQVDNKKLKTKNIKLKEIVDLALDIHTRDPINLRNKWGLMGPEAECLLINKIGAFKENDHR